MTRSRDSRIEAALAVLLACLMTLPLAGEPEEPRGKDSKVIADRERRRVIVPAVVLEQGKYQEQLKGAIEYVLVAEGGKAYESLFETSATIDEIAAAFREIELPPGRAPREGEAPRGAHLRIQVEYERDGKQETRPVEAFIVHAKTAKPLEAEEWVFTGSVLARDPASEEWGLKCRMTKHAVGLHFQDNSPLLQNGRKEAWTQNIYKAAIEALPPKGTAVRLVFEAAPPKLPGGIRGAHVLISGRVQGVGFTTFAQGEARKLGLEGYVRSLPDGRVEVVAEGAKEQVSVLLEKLERGPRGARVEKLEKRDVLPLGKHGEFEIDR
jgi:acylphosphatase